MLLNGMTFGALGVMAAVLASTHADITRFSTFVILPMTFLCNTFFPLDRVPGAVQTLIRLLPLTHASGSLRSMAYGAAPSLLSLGCWPCTPPPSWPWQSGGPTAQEPVV